MMALTTWFSSGASFKITMLIGHKATTNKLSGILGKGAFSLISKWGSTMQKGREIAQLVKALGLMTLVTGVRIMSLP